MCSQPSGDRCGNSFSSMSWPVVRSDWIARSRSPGPGRPCSIGLAPHSVRIYNDWTAAELHLYSTGGHGFGMRTQNLPSDRWIELFANWLEVQGLLQK